MVDKCTVLQGGERMKKTYEGLLEALEQRIILLCNDILPSIRLKCGLSQEYKFPDINPITGQKMLQPFDELELENKSDKQLLSFTRGAIYELGTLLSNLPNSKAFDISAADLNSFVYGPTDLMVLQMEEE
jgi:hypothetical protein